MVKKKDFVVLSFTYGTLCTLLTRLVLFLLWNYGWIFSLRSPGKCGFSIIMDFFFYGRGIRRYVPKKYISLKDIVIRPLKQAKFACWQTKKSNILAQRDGTVDGFFEMEIPSGGSCPAIFLQAIFSPLRSTRVHLQCCNKSR